MPLPSLKRQSRPCESIAFLPVVLAALLAGCADRNQFPSLMRRPAEAAYRTTSTPRPASNGAASLSADLPARLDGLLAAAREANAQFEQRRSAATAAISAATGAAPGSERWSVASIALAGLETARSRTALPLADLDRLEAEASNRAVDGSDLDLKAVRAAREQVDALMQRQDAAITALRQRLAE
ncbi:MAG: hypothetical protein ACK40C_11480 [Novosphingobium meiothermophilum]